MVVKESLVITVEEAGRLLGLRSRNTAYEAVRRGDIPALRIGNRWIVPKAAIAQMLAQVKIPGTDESKSLKEGPGSPVSDK